jgi:voltage-gated potassium channel
MKKNKIFSLLSWNTVLTISVFIFAFIIPILTEMWGKTPARLCITLIFVAAVLSIDKRKRYILYLAFGAFMLEWISGIFDLWFFVYTSRFLNILFFITVVFALIKQIATAKIVTSKEILESISGYLLIGILFSIVVSVIIQKDPGAYNIPVNTNNLAEPKLNLSQSMYYGYITLASLGYGDIVPLKPYTRSLATLICISGQLYIAILISLLVGKYASRKNDSVQEQ